MQVYMYFIPLQDGVDDNFSTFMYSWWCYVGLKRSHITSEECAYDISSYVWVTQYMKFPTRVVGSFTETLLTTHDKAIKTKQVNQNRNDFAKVNE